MRRFVDLTDRALDSLRDHNHKELAKLLDANFDCRQSFCVLNPKHVEMIETARTVGVSAKYAGSGGAIVGTFGDVEQLEALQTAMRQIGCEVIQPQL
jgi:glucuronokinase